MRIWMDQTSLGFPVASAREFSQGRLFLGKSDPLHLDGWDSFRGRSVSDMANVSENDQQSLNFSDMLLRGLSTVNQLDLKSGDFSGQFISDSSSVEVHEVALASAKASMSLGIAKAVIDRMITGFRDILNQR